MEDFLKIVVAGEVDSGKSTLIGRFLYEAGGLSLDAVQGVEDSFKSKKHDFDFAHLLDSLEEERDGSLTIDTTQVFCRTSEGKELVFIDVPGHQELLKNMLCGTSYADIAVLVVDVQRSVEEQTIRHAFILKFLGIEKAVVVLNKMDIAGFDEVVFKKVSQSVSGLFKNIQLQAGSFIPVSASHGDNLVRLSEKTPWYKGPSLVGALSGRLKKKPPQAFRFPVQDVYTINKERLAVGSIISGEIKKGDRVRMLPVDEERIVKGIRIFDKRLSMARAPFSVGLTLDNMENISRGQVICKPGLPEAKKEFLAKIFCVSPMRLMERLRFSCATQESWAWVKEIKEVRDTASLERKNHKGFLEDSDAAEVVIAVENPVAVESVAHSAGLGRFVLKGHEGIRAAGFIE